MKKKVLSLLLVAAMGVSMLVGCGGGDTDAGSDAGANAGNEAPKKLTIWAPENQQELLKKQAEEFKAAYPDYADYEIVVQLVGDDVAKDEILKDVDAAGDVFCLASDQIASMVDAGAIAKLGGEAETLVKEKMAPSVVTTVTIDGSIYAVPYTHNTFYMYYDKSIMTEEDLKSLDTIMAKDTPDGVYNFLFDGGGGWKLGAWYYGAGCSVYGMDGSDVAAGCDFNNETGVAVTKYLAEMHASDKLALGLDVTELISNHKLGAWFGGDWELNGFTEALGEDLGYTTIPTMGINGEQVQMKSFYSSKVMGVNAKSKNPAAAVAFVTFVNSAEQQAARFEATSVIPSNSEAADTDAVKSSPLAAVIMEESNNCAIMQPYTKEFGDVYWNACTTLCDALKSGELKVDNAQEWLDNWVKVFE